MYWNLNLSNISNFPTDSFLTGLVPDLVSLEVPRRYRIWSHLRYRNATGFSIRGTVWPDLVSVIGGVVFISVRNFKLMVSNLKSWFRKLQKSSILKSAALVILWGEEKKGRKNPRFLIFKDRGFQAKFVSFFSKNLTMSLFLVRAWYSL